MFNMYIFSFMKKKTLSILLISLFITLGVFCSISFNCSNFNSADASSTYAGQGVTWMTDFGGGEHGTDPDTHWDQGEWTCEGACFVNGTDKRLYFTNNKSSGFLYSNSDNDENCKFLIGSANGSYFVYDFDMIAWSYGGMTEYGGILLSLGTPNVCNSVKNIQ